LRPVRLALQLRYPTSEYYNSLISLYQATRWRLPEHTRHPRVCRVSSAIRKGDTLVVAKLDRLARSIPDLVRVIDTLEEKQATLRILAMSLDTNTPTGRLILGEAGLV
jgi:hypothetical protein